MALPKLTDQEWGMHISRARDLTSRIPEITTWTKLGAERRKVILERAAEEGINPRDAEGFWGLVRGVVTPGKVAKYVDGWSEGGRTLETLLRVPKRGNPDHFQRLSDMEDPASAKGYVRTTHTRNEKEELFQRVYGDKKAEELLDDGGPVTPEQAQQYARQIASKLGRIGKG